MDTICQRCGEAIDVHHVYHDMTVEERVDFLAGRGCSTSCAAREPVRNARTAAAAAVAIALGDDLDGAASMLDDMPELLGL